MAPRSQAYARLVTQCPDPGLLDYFAAHRLFGVLPREALESIAAQTISRTYARGHNVYTTGDPTTYVYVIRSGLVAMMELDERSTERVLITYSADDVSGSMCATLGMAHSCTATAILDSEILHIPKRMFDSYYEQYPKLGLRVLQEVSQIVQRSRRTIMRLTLTPVPARVASFLLDETDPKHSGAPGHSGIEHTLSHQDLALLLGTTRESVTRVLDRLSRDGVIAVSRRSIEVLQPDRLRQLINA